MLSVGVRALNGCGSYGFRSEVRDGILEAFRFQVSCLSGYDGNFAGRLQSHFMMMSVSIFDFIVCEFYFESSGACLLKSGSDLARF